MTRDSILSYNPSSITYPDCHEAPYILPFTSPNLHSIPIFTNTLIPVSKPLHPMNEWILLEYRIRHQYQLMEPLRTVLVTGSNKGIGYILSQQLAMVDKYNLIMTSRDKTRGSNALSQIKQRFLDTSILYHQLDITDLSSIQTLVDYLNTNRISIDVLVNNAAMGYDQPYQIPSQQLAERYFLCNYFGTVNFTYKILDLLSENSKIINVSSRTGALENHREDIQRELMDPGITREDLEEHVRRYLKGCRERNLEGYYWSAYSTSKTLLNIWSCSILKKQLKEQQSVILMSPGFCRTDMVTNSKQDPRTQAPQPKDPILGVNTLMHVIERIPYDHHSSGSFYYDCKEWNIYKTK